MAYLWPLEGNTFAKYERRDGKPNTALRVRPSEKKEFVPDPTNPRGKSAIMEANTEVVVLFPDSEGPDGRSTWKFLMVHDTRRDFYGWLKTDHVHFDESERPP